MRQKNFIVSLILAGGIMAAVGSVFLSPMHNSPVLCGFSAAEAEGDFGMKALLKRARGGFSPQEQSSPESFFLLQWGLKNEDFYLFDQSEALDVRAEAAWDIFASSEVKEEIIVALIDTGVDTTHSDLSEAIWTNPEEIPGDGIDNDGNGYADDIHGWNFIENSSSIYAGGADSHGTHNAGIIGAAWDGRGIHGIADNHWVKIMVLKALDPVSNRASNQAVREAIDYAEKMGADIVNISMTSTEFDSLMYRQIAASSMLFVVAAGNGDEHHIGYDLDARPAYPAAYDLDNIISVANVGFDGSLNETSNYGLYTVDIGAPGLYILSTAPDGLYDIKTGTSMAVPFVAGAAAMLYSVRPEATAVEIREAILTTARTVPSLSRKVSSGGMLDFGAAMEYILVKDKNLY